MVFVTKELPVEFPVVVPLSPHAKLTAHEEQFLAGHGVLVGVQHAQVCKLLPVIAWHLGEQRTFPVNNFVVR